MLGNHLLGLYEKALPPELGWEERLRAVKELGIRVPEDISIIGFDGLPFSAMSDPPLTTVNVPCADIGRWAVNILHQQIRGRIRATSRVLVSTHLHVRKSTAAPRAAETGKE